MTLERAFESCTRDARPALGQDARRVARDEFGACLCGLPIADHFADDNTFLSCGSPLVLVRAARLRRAKAGV